MFTLYLACLIFGGILLGASLFSFGGSEHSGADGGDLSHDGDFSSDNDFGHDSQIDSHSDIATHDTSHNLENISKSSLSSEAAQFFSIRNLVFFITFFGLTGSVFSWIGIGGVLAFLSSLGIGSFSYIFAYGLMKYLRNSESGQEIQTRELIGKTGVAGFPFSKLHKGKAVIYIGSYSREFTVVLSESSEFEIIKQREKILVIDIVDNCLIVDKLEV